MINLYESVLQHPNYHRQFSCNDSLITVFSCPAEARLMKNKFSALWTQYNYLFYVVEGRKIWHTSEGSYDIGTGSCVFVRKGAFVLEQFFVDPLIAMAGGNVGYGILIKLGIVLLLKVSETLIEKKITRQSKLSAVVSRY